MRRILVIDDDAQLRELFRIALERAGFSVDLAADGAQGLKMCAESDYRVVVTDIVMPDKEGLETILELRRKHPAARIIAISGGGRNAPELYLDAARSFGAELCLQKPIPMEKLVEAVRGLSEPAEG